MSLKDFLGNISSFGIVPPKTKFFITTPKIVDRYVSVLEPKEFITAKNFLSEYLLAARKQIWIQDFIAMCGGKESFQGLYGPISKAYKKMKNKDLPKLREKVDERKDEYEIVQETIGVETKMYVKLDKEYQDSIYNTCCITDGTLMNMGPRVAIILLAQSSIHAEELSRQTMTKKQSNELFVVEKEALTT